jgi:hypothetical protein
VYAPSLLVFFAVTTNSKSSRYLKRKQQLSIIQYIFKKNKTLKKFLSDQNMD